MVDEPPLLLYGTAGKHEKTADYTKTALMKGFVGVDTANYPTAYEEKLTGDGIAAALKRGIKREDLFIQTKFTPVWAQEDKDQIPFDPDQPIEDQIKQSIQQSLDHLQVEYIDALLLHIYFEDDNDTLTAWRAFESYVPHTIRSLGASNFDIVRFKKLYEQVDIKPVFLQNRFYKATNFDIQLRKFCKEHNVTYQAFHMLNHNPDVIESDVLASVVKRLDIEKGLAFYLLILGLGGTCVLNGTSQPKRMTQDVETVSEVFSSKEALEKLQPDIKRFEELLEYLTEKLESSNL